MRTITIQHLDELSLRLRWVPEGEMIIINDGPRSFISQAIWRPEDAFELLTEFEQMARQHGFICHSQGFVRWTA